MNLSRSCISLYLLIACGFLSLSPLLVLGKLDARISQTFQQTSLSKNLNKLSLPVKGSIAGSTEMVGLPKQPWKGLYFKTNPEAKVSSICAGTVRFSGEFPGFGLSIVIEDPEGMLLFYGNNSDVYKKVNDPVSYAEVIAKVGLISKNMPGSYLEVSQNSTSLNLQPLFSA